MCFEINYMFLMLFFTLFISFFEIQICHRLDKINFDWIRDGSSYFVIRISKNVKAKK